MVNPQLIEYLRREEAQGFSAQQLRAWLLQNGYSEQEVDEGLQYAAQQQLHPAFQPPAPGIAPKAVGVPGTAGAGQKAISAEAARAELRRREQAARQHQRSRGVTTAAVLLFVQAVLLLLLAGLIVSLRHPLVQGFLGSAGETDEEVAGPPFIGTLTGTLGFVLSGMLAVLALALVVAGWGAWKIKKWARMTGLILGILCPPLGWAAAVLLFRAQFPAA